MKRLNHEVDGEMASKLSTLKSQSSVYDRVNQPFSRDVSPAMSLGFWNRFIAHGLKVALISAVRTPRSVQSTAESFRFQLYEHERMESERANDVG